MLLSAETALEIERQKHQNSAPKLSEDVSEDGSYKTIKRLESQVTCTNFIL